MLLAEALAQRAEATQKVAQLNGRIAANARFQEGETPAEDANELIAQAEAALVELESLIARINRTNTATVLADGRTLTDALATRDVLKMRHKLLVGAADAAVGTKSGWGLRQLRSELVSVTTLDVPTLRTQADRVAAELRELDLRIQQANWNTELAA